MDVKVRLEVGDFSLVRKLVGKGEADLLAFDPPYNLGKRYTLTGGGGDRLSQGEYELLVNDVIDLGVDVANGRMAIVLSRTLLDLWVAHLWGKELRTQVVVVRKRAQGVQQGGLVAQWVPVVLTGRPVKGVRLADVWEDIRLPGEGYFFREERCMGHPAITSVRLMERIVQGWSNAGGLVVDPFLGSGATAVACWQLGRRFVGVDREQRFVEGVVDRLAWETGRREPQ